MTKPLRRSGDRLFHQQCWLWGCDIRRPQGNVLLEYGFTRQRPPERAKGSSAYLLQCDAERLVVLWGFGMFYGSSTDGGIYIGRYRFTPEVVPFLNTTVAPWLPEHLVIATRSRAPTTQQWVKSLFVEALHWVACYEAWVLEAYGLAYRQQCVAAWKHGPCQIPAEQLVDAWHQLATLCSKA